MITQIATKRGMYIVVLLFSMCINLIYAQGEVAEAYPKLPLQKGIIFRVQIASSELPLPAGYFKNVKDIWYDVSADGVINYVSGEFKYAEAAEVYKEDMLKQGHTHAYVVAYNDGSRLSAYEAKQILDGEDGNISLNSTETKKRSLDEPSADTVKTAFIEQVKENVEIAASDKPVKEDVKNDGIEEKIIFRVQVAASKKPLGEENTAFKIAENVISKHFDDGYTRYFTGSLERIADAVALKNEIVAKGISGAFVVVFHGDKKITLQEAQQLLKNRKF